MVIQRTIHAMTPSGTDPLWLAKAFVSVNPITAPASDWVASGDGVGRALQSGQKLLETRAAPRGLVRALPQCDGWSLIARITKELTPRKSAAVLSDTLTAATQTESCVRRTYLEVSAAVRVRPHGAEPPARSVVQPKRGACMVTAPQSAAGQDDMMNACSA